jgi:hypothetical protein
VAHVKDRSRCGGGRSAGYDAQRARNAHDREPDDGTDDEPAQRLVRERADAFYRFLGISEMTLVGTVRGRLGIAACGRLGCRFLLDLAQDGAEPGHVRVTA